MKSIKDITEGTINVVVPAAKNAGEYVCFIGKTAKDGFCEGKKKIMDFFKYTDKKKLVFNIILIAVAIGVTALAVMKVCSIISEFKTRKYTDVIEQD